MLLSPSREEGDSHSLTLVCPAGEFILPFFILFIISLVLLINHPQMHLTISWHFKSIDFRSLVTLKMGNKKKGSSNFCWLVKNLKDAIKSAFRFIHAARSQGRNVVLCPARPLVAAAAATALGCRFP